MDEELREMAAERICKDYDGCVDTFQDLNVFITSNDKRCRVEKIEYKDGKFHYYHVDKIVEFGPERGFHYEEIFPNEEDEFKILDEFYAWY